MSYEFKCRRTSVRNNYADNEALFFSKMSWTTSRRRLFRVFQKHSQVMGNFIYDKYIKNEYRKTKKKILISKSKI